MAFETTLEDLPARFDALTAIVDNDRSAVTAATTRFDDTSSNLADRLSEVIDRVIDLEEENKELRSGLVAANRRLSALEGDLGAAHLPTAPRTLLRSIPLSIRQRLAHLEYIVARLSDSMSNFISATFAATRTSLSQLGLPASASIDDQQPPPGTADF